jgi:hypothetical protein
MDFLVIIGVVMIVEGIPWFLSPRGYKRLLTQVLPLNDWYSALDGPRPDAGWAVAGIPYQKYVIFNI